MNKLTNYQHQQSNQQQQQHQNKQATDFMVELFDILKAVTAIGKAFNTPEGERVLMKEWALALEAESLATRSKVRIGVEAVRKQARNNPSVEWWPTLGWFISKCKQEGNILDRANRALHLFNSAQRQVCNIGRKVVGQHKFDLKRMAAGETKALFIEYYLEIAQQIEFKLLDSHLLDQSVELNEQQQKDAEDRTQAKRQDFFDKYAGKNKTIWPPAQEPEQTKVGVKMGSTGRKQPTVGQIDQEKKRQMAAIQHKLDKKKP